MRIAIFFATREGHTLRIAEHLASELLRHGVETDIFDVRRQPAPADWTRYATAIVAAPIHVARHPSEMMAFVRQHRVELARLDAAFLSVSLSERGAEDPAMPDERRPQFIRDVSKMLEDFVAATGWRPARMLPVAGALAYRRYNPLVRFVIKRIARHNGAPTDTSRNYDLTNWAAIDRFAADVARAPHAAADTRQ